MEGIVFHSCPERDKCTAGKITESELDPTPWVLGTLLSLQLAVLRRCELLDKGPTQCQHCGARECRDLNFKRAVTGGPCVRVAFIVSVLFSCSRRQHSAPGPLGCLEGAEPPRARARDCSRVG